MNQSGDPGSNDLEQKNDKIFIRISNFNPLCAAAQIKTDVVTSVSLS